MGTPRNRTMKKEINKIAAEVQTEFNEVKDHASCTDGYEGPEDPFRPV